MKILEGEIINVKHFRKGNFKGIALKDFDSEKEEFYPIALAEEIVRGESRDWIIGEKISCRASLCKI